MITQLQLCLWTNFRHMGHHFPKSCHFTSLQRSRFVGGALRDATKNGCVGDYHFTKITLQGNSMVS